ncbi:MAG: hypothetical protein KBT02_03655 [Treponema sp.]|nr:hypothetical protein [Candidatus Treponema caballi]
MAIDKREIYEKLKYISDESEKEFLELSDTFPVLIQEIDATGKSGHSNAAFEEFSHIQRDLQHLLKQQEELLSKNIAFLNSIRTKNSDLFASFTNNTHLLDDVQQIILGIKDGSEEMEVISLNAMVVSIHSGKAGQAFSYITSNLKEMSLRLITQSEALFTCRSSIQESLADFQAQIQATDSVNEDGEKKITDSNEGMLEASNRITDKLGTIIEQAKEVKHPIIKAMEGIQMQDIIRQSLDDVLIAINKITDPADDADPIARLEQYTANTRLATICSRCLSRIQEKLDNSINTFTTNQMAANQILYDINDTVESFTNASENTDNELKQLKSRMVEAVEDFERFSTLFKSYQTIQNKVMEAVNNIQHDVANMSKVFSGFMPITTMLNYVAIAQRIEVARNEAIASIKDTVEHMSNIIESTKEDVNTAQKKLSDYTDAVTQEIDLFLERSAADKINFSTVDEQKLSYSSALESAYDKLTSSVKSVTIYTPEFFTSYNRIDELMGSLMELSEKLTEATESVNELLEYHENKCAEVKNEYSLENIEIHNQDILDFIGHFTITEDKLEAGSVAGVDVQQGTDAGDITFF